MGVSVRVCAPRMVITASRETSGSYTGSRGGEDLKRSTLSSGPLTVGVCLRNLPYAGLASSALNRGARMADDQKIAVDDIVEAATNGVLRAFEARKISPLDFTGKNGFHVKIDITAGGFPSGETRLGGTSSNE